MNWHTQYRLDNNSGGNFTGTSDVIAAFTISQEDTRSGNPRSMTLTNSYNTETKAYKVIKTWKDQTGKAMNWPQKSDGSGGVEIELSVYMNDPITNAPMYQESPIKTVILDGTADGNGETEAGRAQFTDLPKYRLKQVTTPSENEGEDPIVTWEPEEIQYYLKETGPEGYETTTVLNGSEVTVSSGLQLSANTTTITNKKKAADPITLIKAWDSNPPPAGANAVLTLYGCPTQTNGSPLLSKSTEIKTVTLDGTPDGNGESEAWKAVFTDLPLVSDDGSTMFYYVKERECTVGYEPVYGEEVNGKKPTYAEVSVDPTTSERSITVLNRRAVVDFTVNKQWKGTNENKWPNEETAKTIVLHLKRHEKTTVRLITVLLLN